MDEFSKNMHRGYSVSTIEVLARLKHANFEDVSYPAKEVMTGETGDNGCAMYVAPIALWCANKTELNLNDQVREASALTHFHEMAVLGALLQANAMRLLLTNDGHLNVDYFLDEIIDSAGLQKSVSTGPSFVHQMQQMRKLLNVSNPSEERVVDVLGHSSQAMYSVPTAIYCFLRGVRHPNEVIYSNKTCVICIIIPFITDHKNNKYFIPFPQTNPFRDAIEYAITLGGHSNTITSMTGALCGAYYGESVISPNMLIQCEGFNEITEISQELYKNSEKVR